MKKIIFVIIVCISAILYCSCSDQTYANLVKQENQLIQDYVNTHPGFTPLNDGMYFRLLSKGEGETNPNADTIKAGNMAIIRFVAYTLTTPQDSISNWTSTDFQTPPQFVYGSSSLPCQAWLTAIPLMKYQNSIAEIIAPSRTGFSSYANSYALANWGVADDATTVTPRLYKLKLQFEK